MAFLPTDEQQMLIATVRRFVRREIWLWEKRIDLNAPSLPEEVFAELREKVRAMGLHYFTVPTVPGISSDVRGPGLDLHTQVLLMEEVAQHRAGVFAPGYGLFGVDIPPPLLAATAAQQERYLVPLLRGHRRCFSVLSDPAGPGQPADNVRPRARWMGHEWMLDGTKIYVADAGAEFGIIFAKTQDTDETPRGISCFIVDADRTGFQRWRPYPTVSTGRDTQELNFSNLRLPPENLLGDVGGGRDLGGDWYARRALLVASQLTGIGAAAHEMAIKQSWGRRLFEQPIAKRDDVRRALVDSEIEMRCCRLLTWDAAHRFDADQPFTVEAAAARLLAAETAQRVVDRSIQLHGSAGISADLPLERWYRDLRARRLDDGGTEAQRHTIADTLLTTFRK